MIPLAAGAIPWLAWGGVMHLIADWILQNDWMARNKASLLHPASWAHAAIQGVAMLLVFGPTPAWAALAIVHPLIDTRIPVRWWARTFGQTRDGRYAQIVEVMVDQALHVACIALAALWTAHGAQP